MLHISGLTAGDALGPAASRLNPQCTYFHWLYSGDPLGAPASRIHERTPGPPATFPAPGFCSRGNVWRRALFPSNVLQSLLSRPSRATTSRSYEEEDTCMRHMRRWIYKCIYIYTHTHIYTYTHIYIYREKVAGWARRVRRLHFDQRAVQSSPHPPPRCGAPLPHGKFMYPPPHVTHVTSHWRRPPGIYPPPHMTHVSSSLYGARTRRFSVVNPT